MRLLRGLGALLVLGALVVGLPALLILVAGSPIPTELPDLEHVRGILSRPDSTGVVAATVLTLVAWIAWATFTVAVLVEIPARVRGLPTPQVSGLGVQQRLASVLVGAVVAMLGAGPLAATAADAAPEPAVASAQVTSAVVVDSEPHARVDEPDAEERSEPAQEKAQTHEYTVQRGDSLWRIAEEQLGDGQRYKEIAELNYGRQQPGGYSLDTSHWIDPGWVLLIPGPAEPAASAETAPAGDYTVRPGDTLWDIAASELGRGEDYPRIVRESRDIVQPDGSTLSDPDQLQPGWTLRIPAQQISPAPRDEATSAANHEPRGTQTSPEPEREVVDDEVSAPTSESTEPAQEALPVLPPPSSSGDRTAEAEEPRVYDPLPTAEAPALDADAPQDADDTEDVAAIRAAAGVGGLLAAGFISLLAYRRTIARRRRRPGQRIALPAPETEPSMLESDLRAAADPVGVEIVYVALRSLGAWHREQGLPLPELRAARQSGNMIELFLEDEADLPAPWKSVDGRYVWRLTGRDAAAMDLAADASTMPAPYPSLVTVGLDEENANLLLDLEQVGCLGIRGDQDVATAVLTALAVELGTSVWADDLQVTLVGTLPDLPSAIDNGRIRHVSSLAEISRQLEARADAVTAAIEEAGATSLAQARGRGEAGDTWTPEILLVGADLDRADRMRLESLVGRAPRVGVAAVVTGTRMGEWVLDLDPVDPNSTEVPTGTLQPAGIALRPQQLTETGLTMISQLLQQTEQSAPGPSWAENLQDTPAPELEDLEAKIPALAIVPAAESAPDVATVTAPDAAEASTAPTAADDIAVEEPEPVPSAGGEEPEVEAPAPTGPVVRILGDVELEGATGVAPAQNHQRRDLEIIALLALHPEGVSTDKLTEAIWPNSRPEAAIKTRNPAISQTRRWLGQDEDGQPYFPLFSGGVYRLSEAVTTDWDQFLALVGEDIASTPTEQLLAALALIRGRPFKNAKSTRYIWADPLAEEIRAAAVDVAHEVASRALAMGDAATARRASEAGRAVDPADERGWRDGIRAEWAAGRRDAAQRLVDQLRESLSDLDLEPEPETEHLLADLADRIA